MTEAPREIWMSAADEDNEREVWLDPDEGGTRYIRADAITAQDALAVPQVAALVEAVIEEAADGIRRLPDGWHDGISADWHPYLPGNMKMEAIKTLRPDASAALASIERRAEARGMREAAELFDQTISWRSFNVTVGGARVEICGDTEFMAMSEVVGVIKSYREAILAAADKREQGNG